MGAEAFKAARDFLFAHRTDYRGAHAGFRWPQLDTFNYALDWFDAELARGDSAHRLALKIVGDGAATATFAELSERSSRIANGLRALGVKRGERILLMLGNVVPLWEVMLAAMKLGAVVIPASTLLTPNGPQGPVRARACATSGRLCGGCAEVRRPRSHGDAYRGRRCTGRMAWLRRSAAWRCTLHCRWRNARHRSDAAVLHLRHHVAAEAGGAQSPELSGRPPDHHVLDRPAAGRHAPEHFVARLGEARL